MSNRGGARPGAGRKPGNANKKTREIADRAASEGVTPLEVMLRAMREHVEYADKLRAQADEAEIAVIVGDADPDLPAKMHKAALGAISEAATMAKDAAPYCHPRLANVVSTIDGEMRSQIKVVSEFDGDDLV